MVNSAEQITEVDQLTRALVRFLRHPWCLLGALVRFRNSENKGESSQLAWPTNHVATTDLRAARTKKYNRANFTGRSHATQLGSSVSSSWAFFRVRLIPGLRAPSCSSRAVFFFAHSLASGIVDQAIGQAPPISGSPFFFLLFSFFSSLLLCLLNPWLSERIRNPKRKCLRKTQKQEGIQAQWERGPGNHGPRAP